jgi:hypothetical protein
MIPAITHPPFVSSLFADRTSKSKPDGDNRSDKDKHKKRNADGTPGGDGDQNHDQASRQKKQKQKGERVTNSGLRDDATAQKCLQNWRVFLRKMGQDWPPGVPTSACLNFHVRGFCFSSCSRSHDPLGNDSYSKLWEGCRKCCA